MFLTRTDSRVSVTQDPTVSFMETPAGVPPAVKSLFYGSERRGYEFVYGKGEPIMVAKAVPQPEIVLTPNPVAAAPVAVAEPEAKFAAEPAAPVIEPAAEPLPEEPAELPRTATPLPFVAVGGLASLLAGLGLGLLRRRAN
jgi:LPXTG-motif cell wall-anchored protein